MILGTMPTLEKVMQDRFHVEDAQILQAFQALDISHTEEIHYSDFLAAMVSSRIQVHDEVLAQTFRRFDTDSSGFITAANLKEVLGETFEGEETEKLLKEADFTHDGKISYQEFIEYMKSGSATEGQHEACHKIIDTQLSKAGSESKGPTPLRTRTGIDGKAPAAGAGGAPAASPAKEQKGCCNLQ